MMEEKGHPRWHWCGDKLPEKAGEYYVTRRAMGNRPHYNDWCVFEPETGRWKNRRGTVITTVVNWREDDGEMDEA